MAVTPTTHCSPIAERRWYAQNVMRRLGLVYDKKAIQQTVRLLAQEDFGGLLGGLATNCVHTVQIRCTFDVLVRQLSALSGRDEGLVDTSHCPIRRQVDVARPRISGLRASKRPQKSDVDAFCGWIVVARISVVDVEAHEHSSSHERRDLILGRRDDSCLCRGFGSLVSACCK